MDGDGALGLERKFEAKVHTSCQKNKGAAMSTYQGSLLEAFLTGKGVGLERVRLHHTPRS